MKSLREIVHMEKILSDQGKQSELTIAYQFNITHTQFSACFGKVSFNLLAKYFQNNVY